MSSVASVMYLVAEAHEVTLAVTMLIPLHRPPPLTLLGPWLPRGLGTRPPRGGPSDVPFESLGDRLLSRGR